VRSLRDFDGWFDEDTRFGLAALHKQGLGLEQTRHRGVSLRSCLLEDVGGSTSGGDSVNKLVLVESEFSEGNRLLSFLGAISNLGKGPASLFFLLARTFQVAL
jgi:hypothetical protein